MKAALFLLCWVATVTLASAQEHPKMVLIHQLLEATDVRGTLEKLRAENVAQVRSALFAPGAKSGFHDFEHERVLQRMAEKYDGYSRELFAWQKWEKEYTEMYDQYYNEDQLTALLAFYRTDAGQAMLRAMPLITSRIQREMFANRADTSARVNHMMRESIDEVHAEVTKERADLIIDSAPTPTPVGPAAPPAGHP
jgi:hypothetical protein